MDKKNPVPAVLLHPAPMGAGPSCTPPGPAGVAWCHAGAQLSCTPRLALRWCQLGFTACCTWNMPGTNYDEQDLKHIWDHVSYQDWWGVPRPRGQGTAQVTIIS